jgi:hypothetical protein
MTFADDVECRDCCTARTQSPPSFSVTMSQPPSRKVLHLREAYGLYHRSCWEEGVMFTVFPIAERQKGLQCQMRRQDRALWRDNSSRTTTSLLTAS